MTSCLVNEENNEEAGEHFTPRDAVQLMAKLVFLPVADEITDGTYLLYDGACGTGGMLTVAEDVLQQLADERDKQVSTHLFGQEINAETYAICKADLLLKGEGEAADNIKGGPEYSTPSEESKIFDNEAFGYWKVTVEGPLRLAVDLSEGRREEFLDACIDADDVTLAEVVYAVGDRLGAGSERQGGILARL